MKKQVIEYAGIPVGITIPDGDRVKFIAVKYPVIDLDGGNFTADLRWMMHVWVTPETTENADGFFAYLNSDLYEKQAAQKSASSEPSGTTP